MWNLPSVVSVSSSPSCSCPVPRQRWAQSAVLAPLPSVRQGLLSASPVWQWHQHGTSGTWQQHSSWAPHLESKAGWRARGRLCSPCCHWLWMTFGQFLNLIPNYLSTASNYSVCLWEYLRIELVGKKDFFSPRKTLEIQVLYTFLYFCI